MARRINVKPRDLRAEVEAGHLPALRVGGSLLFVPKAVEDALLERAGQKGEVANAV
jgi:hypothetical protein